VVSAQQFARELRSFDDRRKIVQAMRRGLTVSAKPLTARIKASARDKLPNRGGLGAWVAASKIGVRIGYAGRSAGIRLRGGRKSLRDKSDLQRIDAGAVRHPSWGRRGQGSWHVQSVRAGWWTEPLSDDRQFVDAVDAEVDRVLNEIRG
jgi:hypothetical protein